MAKKIKVFNSEIGYDYAATVYDQKESYLNSFEKGRCIPLLGDIKNKKILDVGAGTGRISIPLAQQGAQVTALDVSKNMLTILQAKAKRLPIEAVMGDAEQLSFPDDFFDAVAAAFLIVHLKNPLRFFDEVYRVLKPNGLFLITNINQKDPPEIKTKDGSIVIESFYHRPESVREQLLSLAFSIEKEVTVTEGAVWVNQIILAKK
jgi:ubiquinone/menaquinone biosynthesis C-methylase UbiE